MKSSGAVPDEALMAFLESKGVAASPPKPRGTGQRVIEGLITGYAGPIVGGINYISNQLSDASPLAEWTSWKQWALSHQDWAAWYADEWPSIHKSLIAEDGLRQQWLQKKRHEVAIKQLESARRIRLYIIISVVAFLLLVVYRIFASTVESNSAKRIAECDLKYSQLSLVYPTRDGFNKAYASMGCNQ
jgi:hypothetical protein